MSKGPQIILVDSAFFFALFHPKDRLHKEAIKKQDWLDEFRIIVPWPILYETVNSQFVKSPETIHKFENIMRRRNTKLLDDSKYRKDAYEETLSLAKQGYKQGYGTRSLVDSMLHAIIADVNVRISAMLTFDHRDFGSICALRDIEII